MKSTKSEGIARGVRETVTEVLAQAVSREPGFEPLRPCFFDRIERFAVALALWGSKLNLTAAPDDPAEIAFHIIDSLAPLILAQLAEDARSAGAPPTSARITERHILAGAFAAGMRILDLGSGAGFPALILAAACAADWVLLEARRKRASFLSVTAAEMGLANIRVDSSRTDSMKSEPVFDIVTARAFAEPAVVYRTAASSLRPDGRMILYASPVQRAVIEHTSSDAFEPAVFLEYEVPRGTTMVTHLIAVSRKRKV
jgi:16S rRNA G527 N7-methylase RsmG